MSEAAHDEECRMRRLTAVSKVLAGLALAVIAAMSATMYVSARADANSSSAFVRQAYVKARVVPLATVPDGSIKVDGDLSDWNSVPVANGIIDDVLDHTVGSL